MSRLPVISGKKAVKAFSKKGYVVKRTGSHIILENKDGLILVILNHKEIDKGTLRKIIKDAGLTVNTFCRLLLLLNM